MSLPFSANELDQILKGLFPKRKKLLEVLVNQNSETTNVAGVNKVQGLLEDAFWELGLHTERVRCKDRGDILIAKSTNDPKDPLLLVGHADTVHGQTSGFLTFSDKGETLHGPGVLDMKAGLIQILLALDVLKNKGLISKRSLRILINSAEENSTQETKDKVIELSRGARAALVCEIGRNGNGLVVSRKGVVEFFVESQGKGSHSGNNFSQGINAILPLMELGARASKLTDVERGITVNVAYVQGGGHLCIVPDKAVIGIEVRAGESSELDRVMGIVSEEIKQNENLTLRIENRIEPLNCTPASKALFEAYRAAGREVGVDFAELPRVGGLSDANLIGTLGIPVLDALGPVGEGAHTNKEYVVEASIIERAKALAMFLVA